MDPLTVVVGAATAIISVLSSVVAFLYREVRKLQNIEKTCQQRLAALEGDLVSVNALLEQMRWTGETEIDGAIVADAATGLILEWNPGATILFHWTAREMMGKSVLTLIPERYRQRHLAGVDAVRASGRLPRHGPFQFHALTKEGNELPVEIRYSGWSVGEQRLVGAIVRRRREVTAGAGGGKSGGQDPGS